MLLLDLRVPLRMAGTVYQTQEHPLAVLRTLGERHKAVMMVFNADFEHHRYTCMSYDPASGQTVTADAGSAGEAFELAKAQYQRDTGPMPALQ